ncbi:DUF5710 domain-containing protein [Allosphingosinicella humi]
MDDKPNIYQMWEAHGGPGFWITRATWGKDMAARVVGVGEPNGPPPFYGTPPVVMDVYKGGRLKDGLEQHTTPGTYKTWRLLDAPVWATPDKLRDLDDPAIKAAIAQFDRRGKTRETKHSGSKIDLVVPFARKDEAKRIGARWDAEAKRWWIAADDEKARAKAAKLGFLTSTENSDS